MSRRTDGIAGGFRWRVGDGVAAVRLLDVRSSAPEDRTLGALLALLEEWALRDDLRVLTFSDVASWNGFESSEAARLVEFVAAADVPTIASVRGRVSGPGLAIALACDLRLAAERSTFVIDPKGQSLGDGSLVRLARVVGPSRATAMALLGTRISAREAERWGLVHERVTSSGLESALRRCSAELSRRAPIALRYGKEAVRRALDLPLADGVRLEHDLYVLLQTTVDRAQGVDGFRSQRPVRFQGK